MASDIIEVGDYLGDFLKAKSTEYRSLNLKGENLKSYNRDILSSVWHTLRQTHSYHTYACNHKTYGIGCHMIEHTTPFKFSGIFLCHDLHNIRK